VAAVEQDILAAGAYIIWVQQLQVNNQPGTAENCVLKRMEDLSGVPRYGMCVGDGETEPVAGTWNRSPFRVNRGTDVIVRKSDMRIMHGGPHGTPTRNDDLTGEELLELVRQVTGR
jgi:hypothetical protein